MSDLVYPRGVTRDILLRIIGSYYKEGAHAEPIPIEEVERESPSTPPRQAEFLIDLGILQAVGNEVKLTEKGSQLAKAIHIGDIDHAKENLAKILIRWDLSDELSKFIKLKSPNRSELEDYLFSIINDIDELGVETLIELYEWSNIIKTNENDLYEINDEIFPIVTSYSKTNADAPIENKITDEQNTSEANENIMETSTWEKGSRNPALRISAIQVQNFRNIQDSGRIPLNNITTLVGKNESGKTSFLDVIESFTNEKEYCDQDLSNEVEIHDKSKTEVITVFFEISEEIAEEFYSSPADWEMKYNFPIRFEITKFADGHKEVNTPVAGQDNAERILEIVNEITSEKERFGNVMPSNSIGSDTANNVREKFIEIADQSYDLSEREGIEKLTNDIDELASYTTDVDLSDDYQDLIEGLVNHAFEARVDFRIPDPNIVYYQEYELISNKFDINQDSPVDSIFWDLLSVGDFDLEAFQKMDDFDQDIHLDNVANRVTEKLNQAWSQKQITIQLRYNEPTIRLYVRDNVSEIKGFSNRGLTQPSQRSRGFHWFLSFYINFLAESIDSHEGYKILLLDDPAVHLHPEGKQDWLRTVNEIGRDEQVIYTAHSPYLIDRRNPSRIRVVEDTGETGAKIKSKIFESDQETFEPIRNALGISLGDSPFISKRQILVEGPSDFYILTAVANYFEEELDRDIFGWNEVVFSPVRGANRMVGRASWLASEDIEFALLLDSDERGRDVKERIDDHHPDIETDRVVLLNKNGHSTDVVIEDMFSPEFYVKHFNQEYNEFVEELGESFNDLNVTNTEEGDWMIEECEYSGKRLDLILEDNLEQLDYSEKLATDEGDIELRKRQIAERIANTLNNNTINEDILDYFNPLFGQLDNVTKLE